MSSSGPDLVCQLENVQGMVDTLTAVRWKIHQDAVMEFSEHGVVLIVEETRCLQAKVYLQREELNGFIAGLKLMDMKNLVVLSTVQQEWSEEYTIVERNLEQAREEEPLKLEGDIGGGLVIERQISLPKDNSKVFRVDSGIVARKVGAGSCGYSRLVCLRVHPRFNLLHPTESFVSFVSIDGSKHEVWPEPGEQSYEGNLRPNGEWILVDKCLGLALVNRFDINEVHKCLIHRGTGTVNLELWSEQRPVSNQSPLTISHEYEVRVIP